MDDTGLTTNSRTTAQYLIGKERLKKVDIMRLSKEELQMAVGYVVYMQMASYFDVKPVCENR